MPLDPRSRHASYFPGGYAIRLVAMTGALVLIGATIYSLRNRALAANALAGADQAAQKATEKAKQKWKETIVPGPADEDPLERDEAKRLFEGVVDRQKNQESDTFAFWLLMKWSRRLSFAELEQRARPESEVPFYKLFKSPEEYRGKLIRLRLHVKRVREHEHAKNSAGVKKEYELWGVTDDSIANLYAIHCSELPPGVSVGESAESEVVFVGYFLKLMAYQGGDGNDRGAPELIGRVKTVSAGKSIAAMQSDGLMSMVVIGAAIIVAALFVVSILRLTRAGRSPSLAATVPSLSSADVEAWLQNPLEHEPPEDSHSSPSTNGSAHADS